MSLNLINSYENQFTEQLGNMRELLKDSKKMDPYLKTAEDPKEYGAASNLLK